MLIFIVKDFPEAAAFCEIVLDEKKLMNVKSPSFARHVYYFVR